MHSLLMGGPEEEGQDEVELSAFNYLDNLRKEVSGPISFTAVLASFRNAFSMFDDSFCRRTVLTWFETYHVRHPEEDTSEAI